MVQNNQRLKWVTPKTIQNGTKILYRVLYSLNKSTLLEVDVKLYYFKGIIWHTFSILAQHKCDSDQN